MSLLQTPHLRSILACSRSCLLNPPVRPTCNEDRKSLEREVHARLGDRIQVDIRLVASIPREPNGKFRAVKSSVAGLES